MIYFFSFIWFFDSISVEGYYKKYIFFKYLFFCTSSLRMIFQYMGKKHFSEFIKLNEIVPVLFIILISLSDPNYNTEQNPNIICFHEVFFRYIEMHILILSFYLLFNDKNIEEEISKQIFSVSSIIGRYDSFRYFTFLNLAHYIFTLINGLSFSLK